MTLDEATSEAVLGARVTSDSIQAGAYVYYNFNGLRIAFPCGSSSGWSPSDGQRAADWRFADAVPVGVAAAQVVARLDPNKGGW